jgi:hypothetical protein
MRTIWVDRPRLERRKISLTAVLSKIETFRNNMAARYDHLMDERIPVQKCAKVVKALLLSRLHIMVLHRYHNSVVAPMPDRLRNIMLASGTTTLETAVALETLPELKAWSWYAGAYQQYHAAFLLLMEVYVYPQRKEADRIWACLDWIFECNPEEPRRVKGRKILSELQQKTAVYQSMRGMRAPVQMEKHVGQREPRVSDSGIPTVQSHGLHYMTSPPPEEAARVPGPSVGRVPLVQNVVFSGSANGESIWALPSSQSPDASSDTTTVQGQHTAAPPGTDDLMADIDWVIPKVN